MFNFEFSIVLAIDVINVAETQICQFALISYFWTIANNAMRFII